MCGICGFIGREDPRLLGRMAALLAHRGPDDEGVHIAPIDGGNGRCIHLGNRRLSIIDLSPAGHQPMANEDGSVRLTYNGEIYNYREVRRTLASRGHRFRSQTDTEVILRAYEEWGDVCLDRLHGMFAFGLWDARRRRLLLARDRMGKKPVYYAGSSDGGIVFASEIKSILTDPDVRRSLDPIALDHYLTFQYVPAPRTLVGGVHKLPPGHTLTWQDGKTEVREYWDTSTYLRPSGDTGAGPSSFREAKEELRRRLTDSVAKRLVSDVPVGLLLSGGIDSSLLAVLMTEASGAPIRTFTVGFQETAFDETAYARRVADRLGSVHREFRLTPRTLNVLPSMVWHLDEPVADQAALPTYLICQLAGQDVSVLLTGEGGDELFLGYPRYLLHELARLYHRLPWPLRKTAGGLGAAFPLPAKLGEYVSRVLRSSPDALARNLDWVRTFPSQEKCALYTSDFAAGLAEDADLDVWRQWSGRLHECSQLRRVQYVDIETWLADDILVKLDRMSMASSVEARAPFLDHDLVEWSLGLPEEYLLGGLTPKRLLKSLAADYLPREIVYRRKQAFRVPTQEWLRGEGLEFARDLLLDRRSLSRGYFAEPSVADLLRRHQVGQEGYSDRIWSLLCLELWQQMFLDQAVASPDLARPRPVALRSAAGPAAGLLIAPDFPPGIGGIQTYLSRMYRDFPPDRLTLIAPAHPGAEAHDLDLPYRAFRVHSPKSGRIPVLPAAAFLMGALFKARKISGRGEFGVTHCGHVRAGIIGRHLKRKYGTPYLVWTYALEFMDHRYGTDTLATLREADLVLTISEYARGELVKLGVDPVKIVKIRPSVDPGQFHPGVDGSSFRERNGFGCRPVLLTVARLTALQRYKGQDMVIRSLPQVVRVVPDILYAIAGDGGDAPYLQALARDLGVEENVRLLGRVSADELPSLYAAADLFVMASREERTRRGRLVEGFGIVFLEASASGKPVIGGDSGGVPEAVQDGVTGFLVPPRDPDAIARAVVRILVDKRLAARLGRSGRTWVEQEMILESAIGEFHTALQDFFPCR